MSNHLCNALAAPKSGLLTCTKDPGHKGYHHCLQRVGSKEWSTSWPNDEENDE